MKVLVSLLMMWIACLICFLLDPSEVKFMGAFNAVYWSLVTTIVFWGTGCFNSGNKDLKIERDQKIGK